MAKKSFASDASVAVFRIIDEAVLISGALERAGLLAPEILLGFAAWRNVGRPAEFQAVDPRPANKDLQILTELRKAAPTWEQLTDHALRLAAACEEIRQLAKVSNA